MFRLKSHVTIVSLSQFHQHSYEIEKRVRPKTKQILRKITETGSVIQNLMLGIPLVKPLKK